MLRVNGGQVLYNEQRPLVGAGKKGRKVSTAVFHFKWPLKNHQVLDNM